ncbi:hypothetical protein PMIN01_04491 [Paraphaeosphaeria minitans]|uniref:Uncharacterized protein n=1 Tax=Paraphaeosphaeria minitans TaxID=565426 RepID=A0A9P6GJ63_9PLEO|nr:hypothetical protein PMIN01_04491 [Paraphaeosphaeria minitans]
MASMRYFPHQSVATLQHNRDVRYRPVFNDDGSLRCYAPQYYHAQDTVTYMLILPTPLVSIPMPQPTRRTVTLFEAARKVRREVVEEEVHGLEATEDRVWGTGCARWWTQSDVKWNGYVEYPESCERSSVAREKEFQRSKKMP